VRGEEGIGESEMEELVPEWGWRRDKGYWMLQNEYHAPHGNAKCCL